MFLGDIRMGLGTLLVVRFGKTTEEGRCGLKLLQIDLTLCPSYRNVFAADGFRYLPDGSVCWMFATAGISVGRFYRMGT